METIKVNMNPNPLDVQTIHASQNDNEAREWGFELHNNGELIDTSDVTEQMFFKAYKGGTEQILPENTSTPTTSPFKGDIRYPQGLLTDQEFTYRQSPTESDGLAKIQTIYGNTLKWNQLATFATRSGAESGLTYEFKADGTIVFNGTATDTYYANLGNTYHFQGHKLYIRGCPSGGSNSTYYLRDGYNGTPSEWDFGNGVIVTARANTILQIQILQGVTVTNLTFIPQLFDLTAMGLDTLTIEEVKQWFADYYPLPYYQYDSGSLLPFNGEGLKTVGFNQWDEETRTDGYFGVGGDWQSGNYVSSVNPISVLPNTEYYLCEKDGNAPIYITQWTEPVQSGSSHNLQFISRSDGIRNVIFRTAPNCHAIHINCGGAYGNVYKNDICINISSSKNGTYEPYTSTTTSLPISTYFPTGMKSAGTAYDELTPTKAITRIGVVDLGTLNWTYVTSGDSYGAVPYFWAQVRGKKLSSSNILCPKYTTVYDRRELVNNSIGPYNTANSNVVCIKDESFTDVQSFKTSLSGVYLYYELATPTETSFTTASLVTENTEIPLANEDGVLTGKCTEQLSAEPGFHDAKIKLSDSDGTCYSNKLQLHVERSPQ